MKMPATSQAPRHSGKKDSAPEPTSALPRSVVLGTAGHIDHGKTALVLALTGTDTDRLPEEKSRGITIDLGFAALQLTDKHGTRFDLSLIDVPGHHAFLRNMLAGAGGIDCVMLIVAADEGPRAQTAEHLTLCTLLGIRRGLVVLTKTDAVTPERLATAHLEVAELVEGTFLEAAPVLVTSARTRAGIPELKQALAALAAGVPERSRERVLRLPLDRAFTVKGFGTVVTGTLQSGTLRAGASYLLEPQNRTIRVRGTQVHGTARAEVAAPNRVALNLAGIEVGEIHRGDTLVALGDPAAFGTLHATAVLDAVLTAIPGAPPLRHRSRVRVHAFASESLATLLLYNGPRTTAPGTDPATAPGTAPQTVFARLRLAKPMVLAPGDRFVVRQSSPALTLAGGLVLDAQPLPRQRRPATLTWLQQIATANPAQQLLLRVARRDTSGLTLPELVAETGLTPETLTRQLAPLLAEGKLISASTGQTAPNHLLSPEALAKATKWLLAEVTRAKAAVPAPELRSRTKLNDWVFTLAVRELERRRELTTTPAGLALPAPAGIPAPPQNARLTQVEALYRRAGLHSPILSEAAAILKLDPKQLQGLLTELLRAKKLIRLGADNLLIHTEPVAQLVTQLQTRRGQPLDVAAFKTLTGLTRKHAIPLLEYLDGTRITGNNAGVRTIL